MKRIFNVLKGILFLILGITLIITPYARFKETFPAAPAPLVIKMLGIVTVICGGVILAALLMDNN